MVGMLLYSYSFCTYTTWIVDGWMDVFRILTGRGWKKRGFELKKVIMEVEYTYLSICCHNGGTYDRLLLLLYKDFSWGHPSCVQFFLLLCCLIIA